MEQRGFDIQFTDEVRTFLKGIHREAAAKITYNVRKVCAGNWDAELFKKLDGSDGIWELRTHYGGIQYRLLAFWDTEEQRLVVATHGFVKKRWRVPDKEVRRAVEIRKRYYEQKHRKT